MVLPSTPHREHPLSQPRNITIVATLVAVTCGLAAVPIAAFGDDGPTTIPGPSAELVAALEVQADVAEVNEFARDEAPTAVGSRCNATLDVPGIGDTCAADDGLLRVEQADGRSHTIHGVDAPPLEAGSLASASQSAVNGADVADITCVPAGQPHYVLLYARPGDVASRYSTIAPKLRSETYKLGAFLDSESRSVDPKAGRGLPMRCEGGTPVVLQATLSSLTAGSANFKSIVDALIVQGYEFNGDKTGNERYIVYYDAPSPTGAAGTGHVFTTDSSPGATNENNKGGLYAIEYRYDNGGGVPHWDVLNHEVIHTMGAIVDDAPHSSGARAGHCNDGQDVMCYSDGGNRSSYTASACTAKVLDCNRDDYFNPSPAPGSFLATHWNTAGPANRFLISAATGDTSPPTPVTALAQTGASNAAVGLTWAPASDDKGVSSYVVSVREPGGTWRAATTSSRTAATVTGLASSSSFEVSVEARDAAGNGGSAGVLVVATNDRPDLAPPSAPAGVAVTRRASSATFSWNDSGDDVGVADYELRRLTPSADPARRETRSVGTTPNTSITIPISGLKPGARVEFELVARDGAANTSSPTKVLVVIPKDVRRPTAPTRLKIVTRSASTVTIAWSPSRDNVGVMQYRAYQQVGRRWVFRGNLKPNVSRLKLVRLRARSAYTFRIVARDAAGNASTPSKAIVARTL